MRYLFTFFLHILPFLILKFGTQDNFSHFSGIIHNISAIQESDNFTLLFFLHCLPLLFCFSCSSNFSLNAGEAAQPDACLNVEAV